jgi:hypothetical protein
MRLRTIGRLAGCLALAAWSGSVYAASRDCTTDALFGTENFPVFRVNQGVERLYFIASPSAAAPECPSRAENCRSSAFVVAGDAVLVTWPAEDGLVCGHYIAPEGKVTSGWLDKAALTIQSGGQLGFDAVEVHGAWVNGLGDASIGIGPGGPGYILVEGEATRGPPSYNTGAFEGPAYIGEGAHGPVAGYEDEHYRGESPAGTPPAPADSSCRIRFRFAGPYLLVDDNYACGGLGVTFSGIYAKRNMGAAEPVP